MRERDTQKLYSQSDHTPVKAKKKAHKKRGKEERLLHNSKNSSCFAFSFSSSLVALRC